MNPDHMKAKRGITLDDLDVVIYLSSLLVTFIAFTIVLSNILSSYQQSIIPQNVLLQGNTDFSDISILISSLIISLPFSLLVGTAAARLIPSSRWAPKPKINAKKPKKFSIYKKIKKLFQAVSQYLF